MKYLRLILFSVFAAMLCLSCKPALKDGEYHLTLLTTNDIHGRYFDDSYTGGAPSRSLFAVKHAVDSVRAERGAENVVLVDAGDFLQGDNAAYYYNYVDTVSAHIYPRMAARIGYDAIIVGNHDVETGHPVYDRVARELNAAGIPFLAGNAIRNDTAKPYFQPYVLINKSGVKVLILGYTNPNMKGWLNESIWSGMHFENLIPQVQEDVDRLTARLKPDVIIVAAHSGTGNGDGEMLESQGLDLLKSLNGVDFLVCSHDHRPYTNSEREDIKLINSGSHCRNLGLGEIKLTVKGGKVISKELSCGLIPLKAKDIDESMKADFAPDFEKVKEFTLRPVGELKCDLSTREAYAGMSNYVNLIHTLMISCAPAQISFAAPLTYNGFIPAGNLIYNDLFTIYPYENQLYVVRLSGKEIRNYLEESYDRWIQTVSSSSDHVLNIVRKDDARTSQKGWSFVNRSYNFDSAAGINYTVDVTRPRGERVVISSLAGGNPFSEDEDYFVAMTSYRASGGGGLLEKGAGLSSDQVEERTVSHYPEIRNILYGYLNEMGSIDPSVINDSARIGTWSFVPEKIAGPALKRDLSLLFKN